VVTRKGNDMNGYGHPERIRCRETGEILTFHNEVSLKKVRYVDMYGIFRIIPTDEIARSADGEMDRIYAPQ
jgi:hypothetical protein